MARDNTGNVWATNSPVANNLQFAPQTGSSNNVKTISAGHNNLELLINTVSGGQVYAMYFGQSGWTNETTGSSTAIAAG